MKSDFLDAHERHWQDAETLFWRKRWANADHLYGMAAECGLKRLMLAFGMPYDTQNDRPEEKEDRVHANGIWARFESYSGYHQGAGYALPAPNPFGNWDVAQRYAHQSNFDRERVDAHRKGANSVRGLVHKALLDGLI
ncbi:MAG: SAM-dependent methyltransferase [Deltaproteobacteria bacterium]|nr:SAM-dependent methyltransferase [Deltaproteobacteria bacterium]